ncbi:histidine--tRNA ligase [Proteiniborus sp. MB09-C3]|uniref:histidine--tRNA ligase n=1 Tax=Proteiniborus sp. MB09-C3 TaxID=3050072 RepID=UPI002555B208|nr:histidine--tRNA ligase [Proteiniborus sp. MB09-C3]WIV13296.1 histidine--tRNA ligase [Proteiniborus sp. MB09-C3]
MKLQNLKGTKDFLPEEQIIRDKIKRTLEDTFQRYGYMPLETPMLCSFNLLAYKYGGGDEILKEIYRLSDQGSRELGLRYDLTTPLAKVIGMNPYLNMPFKRYEIGKVFRDGPVKTGRMREFIQCDVDIAGLKSMMAEAELMSMVVSVFDELKLEVYISYNNRKLLYGILIGVGVAEQEINEVVLTLDKLEKIGQDGIQKEMLEKGIDESIIDKILILINDKNLCNLEYLLKAYDNPLVNEGIDELKELNDFLEELGIIKYTKFNPFLARGLDIYTGTVYEVFLSDNSISSSIAAGGRYDKIIGSFLNNGNEYPAVGLTFGLDVIYAAMTLRPEIQSTSLIDILIIPVGTEKESLKLAWDLRKQGIKVDIEMSGKKLNKSLNAANKKGIPYVIVLGQEEIQSGRVTIKDMLKGESIEVSVSEIKEKIMY